MKTGTSITVGFKPYWPDLGPTDGPGLQAEYFNNTALTGGPVLTRLDPTLDFGWDGVTSPLPELNPNFFSARWTGFIVIPTTGSYTF